MRRQETEALPGKLRPAASRLWERALDLIYPPRCVSCDDFGAFMCSRCLSGTAKADGPRCPRCWMPVLSPVEGHLDQAGVVRECGRCRVRRPAFSGLRAVFAYESAARDAVHALKFRGLSAVAPQMAALMAQRLLDWNPPVQAIAPVPLAGQRRRQRGYDQAEVLAKGVSRLTGLPLFLGALVRRRPMAPQARQSGEEERRRNVAGAFAAGPKAPAGGLLLIDDVVTTGATLDACARVLISGGGGPVFALTFARED